MRAILIAFALVLGIITAQAQTSPGLSYDQVPTAGQWNGYFSSKQDLLGFMPLNKAGDSISGPLQLPRYTVASLVAAAPCTTATQGSIAIVTDATSPTFLGALTGGGSVVVLALCNGSTYVAE